MKKFKLSMLAASAICAVAATALTATSVAAADDYRDVTLTGTNVFYAGVTGASVSVIRVTDDSDDGHTDYTSFVIGNDQTVTFRKNLAYDWWAANEEGEGVNGRFNMTVGFEELNFSSYTIAFDSQQYAATEDEVSKNYIVFMPEGSELAVYVTQTTDLAEDAQPTLTLADYSKISIAFGNYSAGNYDINIDGQDSGADFVNVRQNYASFVSSGDNAATPITFSAECEDGESSEMIMYSLNGQSFEVFGAVSDNNGGYTGGTIHDDQAPVVCLNSPVNYLEYGEEVDIDYTTIDVMTTSPRTTVSYYVLTNEQFNATDINYNDTDEESELFTEITTSSSYKLLRDQYTYVPFLTQDGIVETNGYSTYGLVKVCLYVRDTTSSRAQTDYVFVDWYVSDQYKVDIAEVKGEQSTTPDKSFIRIVKDSRGATYGDSSVTDYQSYVDYVAKVAEEYQAKIDAHIAENYPEGLFASSDATFCLPEFSGYITDNIGGYTDLTYSIYYSAGTTGSSTSLDYNELALPIEEAETTYRFTIVATDASGNSMWYYDEDGEMQDIDTSEIWEEEYEDLLPYFEVEVSYKPATVEDPGLQSVGYVGSTYNNAKFDITGVSGTYTANYNLYVFDREALYNETGVDLTYNQVVNNAYTLFFDEYDGISNSRKYFTLVTDDEEYEDLSWNSSSVTFVPQDSSVYYVVRLTLEDTGFSRATTDTFLVVRASSPAVEIYGEDDWLENNVAAIVLYCIAGVFFIAFVVLLVIKPKDKGDVEQIAAQAEAEQQSKKKNK